MSATCEPGASAVTRQAPLGRLKATQGPRLRTREIPNLTTRAGISSMTHNTPGSTVADREHVSGPSVGSRARADHPLRMRPASRLSVVVLIALLLATGVGAAAVLAGPTDPATAPPCSETCAPQLTPVPGHHARLAATHHRRLPDAAAMAPPRRSNDDTR